MKLGGSDEPVFADVVSPAQLGGRGLKRILHKVEKIKLSYRPLSWAGAD